MKVLCVFGKHQYGDPSRGLGIEYAAFVPTLRRLGHHVVHFESWDRRRHADFGELNRALLDVVERERPDALLFVQTDVEIWLETMAAISSRGDVATVSWTTDDSWKYEQGPRFIGRYSHAMATTCPSAVPKYHRDGIRSVLLTQWAANSEFLRPPLSAAQCQIPVAFVGAAHGNRSDRIERLRRHGIEVTCFGHGWPKGPVRAEEIPEIIRKSVISLNFANARGERQIKARTFEVPGAGGFLLTESVPALDQFYAIGREVAIYTNECELAQQIRYFLDHPAERNAVAEAGFERTKRDHTYENRLAEVLTFAVAAKGQWLKHRPPLKFPPTNECQQAHRMNGGLRILRSVLIKTGTLIWGPKRGPRAARRLVFELSWRLVGARTFTAKGLPGRMFPEL